MHRTIWPTASLRCLLALTATLALCGCSQVHPEPELLVVNALNHQADAWNRGHLDEVMEQYWQSDQLTVTSARETVRGWANVRDHLRERHARAPQDGRLRYERLNVEPVSDDSVWVTGRWTYENNQVRESGTFARLFRRIHGRWLIAHEFLTGPPDDEPSAQ